MALQISPSRELSTAIALSALSFYKSTDQKVLTEHAVTCDVNGLTSFICLWCNAIMVAIERKVRFHHTLPFVTKQRSQFGCGYLHKMLVNHWYQHRCMSKQFFWGAKNILPGFSQICPKNFFVQTFPLQIFCSCWCITFSSTMLPYILHFSDGRLIQPWRKYIRKYTNL